MHADDIDATQPAGAEADLQAALGRLQRGAPRHSRLRKLMAKGKLRINISAVATEACRSRTLIGSDGCAYPEIRRQVFLAAKAETEGPTSPRTGSVTAQHIIASLRRENGLLKQEKATLATRVTDAVNVARALERKVKEFERKAARSGSRLSCPDPGTCP